MFTFFSLLFNLILNFIQSTLLKSDIDSQKFKIFLTELGLKLSDPRLITHLDHKALVELKQYLDLVKDTVLKRISVFLLNKISNISVWSDEIVIGQNSGSMPDHQIGQALMLRYGHLYSFLLTYDKLSATKIYNEYVNRAPELISKITLQYTDIFTVLQVIKCFKLFRRILKYFQYFYS